MNETEQFRIALKHLVAARKRGAQREIAKLANIDPVYLNGILGGHKPGSESARAAIAAALGMRYEDMLAMGRFILEGGDPAQFAPTRQKGAAAVSQPYALRDDIPPDILKACRDPETLRLLRAFLAGLQARS